MLRLCLADAPWAAAFLGGLVSDLVGSLPQQDPWRQLSGRVGQCTCGAAPPGQDGAVRADGAPFGTVADALDRMPALFRNPEDDPQLAALASPIGSAGAAVVAAAGTGWECARDMLLAVRDRMPPADVVALDSWRAGQMCTAGAEAARWSLHRRRSYRGMDDTWPAESAFRWAWRAGHLAVSGTWPGAGDADLALAANSCHWFPVEDFDPNDF